MAYQLVNKGVGCTLIDARTIWSGSSCASTSLLQYEIDTPLCKLKDKVGTSNAIRAYQLCAEAILKLGAIANKIDYPNFEFKPRLYYAG